MEFYITTLIVLFEIIMSCVETRSLFLTSQTTKKPPTQISPIYKQLLVTRPNDVPERSRPENDKYVSYDNYIKGPEKKCSIILMSNPAQSLSHQSLLRKYRYDQHGSLIASSLQYYLKREKDGYTVLVPLRNKSVSPAGGFLKYYKEVPPIPYSSLR